MGPIGRARVAHRGRGHCVYGLVLGVVAALVMACGDDTAPSPDRYEGQALCERREELCGAGAQPTAPATTPTLSPPVIVAPSDALPPEVRSQVAHNNLDVAWHDEGTGGRLFFAFRTGPDHFASPAVVMHVVSTPDLVTWRREGEFALGTDVREPQLVSIGGELLFYFVELGADRFDFTPKGTRVTRWLGPGLFGPLEDIFEPGFLVWRIKPMTRPGEAPGEWVYAFGYDGGENIYDPGGEAITVRWLRSRDGLVWEAAVAGGEVVLTGGASETDAAFLPDGRLIAVARNEAGDETGFGSKICRGEASAPATWTCAYDKRKYDSPLVFEHEGAIFLIGRRNLTETGHYDLGEEDKALKDRYLANQVDYWTKPKRCALWKVDPDRLEVGWLLDLPSAGDTCFPEALRLSPHAWLVFNYSSPTDGASDPTWLEGQLGPTHIYWTTLTLP